jgi:hypothetical protein
LSERELRAERLVQFGYDDMDYPAVDTYDSFMEPGGTPAAEDSTTASVASIATKAAKAKRNIKAWIRTPEAIAWASCGTFSGKEDGELKLDDRSGLPLVICSACEEYNVKNKQRRSAFETCSRISNLSDLKDHARTAGKIFN